MKPEHVAVGVLLTAAALALWWGSRGAAPPTAAPIEREPVAAASDPLSADSSERALSAGEAAPADLAHEELHSRLEADPSAPRGLSVSGTVTDARGRAVRGALVRVWREEADGVFDPGFDLDIQEQECAEDGSFKWTFSEPSELRFWATADDRVSSEVAEVRLDPSQATIEVALVLPDPETLKGFVWSAQGGLVEGATVTAYVDVEQVGASLPRGVTAVEYYGRPEARSREDGAFWLYPVRPGSVLYSVFAELRFVDWPAKPLSEYADGLPWTGPGQFGALHEVRPGSEDLELVLGEGDRGGASLRVQLLAEDGGRVPRELRYRLEQRGPHGAVLRAYEHSLAPDAQGALRLSGLRAGRRYALSASGAEGGWTRGPIAFATAAGVTSATLEVPGYYPVTIGFHDPAGRLGEGIPLSVAYRAEAGFRRSRYFTSRPSSEAPEATLELFPGSYDLRLGDGWPPLLRQDIDVPPRATTFTLTVP